jgi:3-hydroxyisobutyrate dehydrogenase-like beta-hydroxyacid dehydrogenase
LRNAQAARYGRRMKADIGLVGAGAMGSGMGAGWVVGGARVVTCLTGRSDRTRALAVAAGLDPVSSLDEVLAASDIVVSVVPPAAALSAAEEIAQAAQRVGVGPLVADLNAVAPSTVGKIQQVLTAAGCALVDGSISDAPPTAEAEPARVYVCGERAGEFAALPNPWLDVVCLSGPVGAASALKMCTASMYKGTKALIMQALLTAEAHSVRAEFLADTRRAWPDDVPTWHTDVAVAASKAWRFVDEMHEIARTQRDAGLPGALFEGVAAAYERAAGTELGHTDPEGVDRTATVDAVIAALKISTADARAGRATGDPA